MHHILQAHPAMTGVLVDRPPVIKLAEAQWSGAGPFAGAAERAELVGASFFDKGALPPAMAGDAYYMRYILHDWPTDEATSILRNVREAIGSTGATLLIGECAIPDHDTVGVPPVMYQIDIQSAPHALSNRRPLKRALRPAPARPPHSREPRGLPSATLRPAVMVAFGEAQERTPAQWRELLSASGFELVAIHPTRSLIHWVEAKPL